jgi:uncharacterized protein (DUF2235 family)
MLFAFDGTGNKDNPGIKLDSNVKRFADAYATGEVFYQEGVGTGGWFDKIIGGVFGYGGKTRVEKAIDYLKDNLVSARHVDIVGFSRGAALALDFCNEVNREFKGSVKIRFVGLFDAVASFGLPGNNINIGYNFKLPHCAQNCYHALALDERRGMFPLTRVVQDTLTGVPMSNITHCWFRGFHSDVGGGNGNPGLSNIALVYMLRQAAACGITINKRKKYGYPTAPEAQCKKPVDLAPNDKRIIDSTDVVHCSVHRREWACKGFEANNPPAGLKVVN